MEETAVQESQVMIQHKKHLVNGMKLKRDITLSGSARFTHYVSIASTIARSHMWLSCFVQLLS